MTEISLKVEVADSVYSLKVKSEEENSVKKAVELINHKIAELERQYAIKDKKDVLAMVALQLVSQLFQDKNHAEQELSTLRNVLAEVENMLKQHKEDLRRTE